MPDSICCTDDLPPTGDPNDIAFEGMDREEAEAWTKQHWDALPEGTRQDIETGVWWDSVNPALREGTAMENDLYVQMIGKADDVFSKHALTLQEDTMAFRGIQGRVFPTERGSLFTDNGYIRMSRSNSIAKEFSTGREGSQLLAIHLRRGQRWLPSDHFREAEMYIPRGAEFRVIGSADEIVGEDFRGNPIVRQIIHVELV